MGLIGDPDNINTMSPPPQPPSSEKAAVSDTKKDTDVAKENSVNVLKDETKPVPADVVDKYDKVNIANEKQPEIQTKPSDIIPEKKSGRHNWTKLKKAISKVRGLIASYYRLVLTLGCQRSNCQDYNRALFYHYPASITYQNENFIKSYIWSTINQYILNTHEIIDLEIFIRNVRKLTYL